MNNFLYDEQQEYIRSKYRYTVMSHYLKKSEIRQFGQKEEEFSTPPCFDCYCKKISL